LIVRCWPRQNKVDAASPQSPAALIWRLAVDRRTQGRGLGAALLFDAIARAIPTDAAVFAFTVDAKDEAAARFPRLSGIFGQGGTAVSAGGVGAEGGGGVASPGRGIGAQRGGQAALSRANSDSKSTRS
jgi:hypothetical protein